VSDEELAGHFLQELMVAQQARAAGLLQQAEQHERLARDYLWQLWLQLRARVERLARRLYPGNPTAIPELVSAAQDRFIAVLDRWDPARGVCVWSWFQVVAARCFISRWRKLRREQAQEDMESATAPRAIDRARQLQLRQQHQAVMAFLEQHATDDELHCVHLFVRYTWERWTLEDLASQEGVATSTMYRFREQGQKVYARAYRQLFPEEVLRRGGTAP
jgi:hypothetical protein